MGTSVILISADHLKELDTRVLTYKYLFEGLDDIHVVKNTELSIIGLICWLCRTPTDAVPCRYHYGMITK